MFRALRFFSAAILALMATGTTPALAETSFTILGTRGGPVPSAHRGQPANLLKVGSSLSLIDVGDGTAGQLMKVGLNARQIDNLFISHLHADHYGGLLALLGLRFQTNANAPLQVYGPPGTRQLVKGILDGMSPAIRAGYGTGEQPRKSAELAIAHELQSGDAVIVDGFTLRVVANTHYSFPKGSKEADEFLSLSLRFETPDRTIVYTGDTGPSTEVEEFGKGADLLVAEVIELDGVMASTRQTAPDMTDEQSAHLAQHLSEQHLRPADLGRMAAAIGAPKLVVTHIAAGPDENLDTVRSGISSAYDGEIVIAEDLDKF